MQSRRSSRPIRWWLATFGSAVAFPFIVLLALMFIVQIRDERTAARTTALRVSRAAADRLVGLRSDSLALLRHMASRPSIQSVESQPCDSFFAIVDFFPQYVNLFLFDGHGHLRCSANPPDPRDRAVSADAQHWLEEQLRGGHLQFEQLTIQQSAGQWMSTIAIPLPSGATLAVVALPEVIAKEALPPEAVVTILDRHGTVLARSADPTRWTGRNTRASGVTQLVLQRKEGTAESTGIDGISRQYGFTFVPELGWYIYVGIPTAVVMGPVRRLYFRGLIAGLLVIFVAVFVAVILSRRVERPINQLAAGASSVARGEYDKVESPQHSPLEITMLAEAFNEMVESRASAELMMEESEQRLKALSERLLVIQEDERARIARAIHDDLGQSLTALKMDVLGLLEKNNIPPSPTSERIQRTLDSTVSAVQQISKELRPSMLDDLGLMTALEAEVRLFEERSGVECELSLPDAQLALDAASSTVLYRIVQEALTNVVRHSNATRVEIRLRHRGGEVLLEIRDDGRGITTDEVSSPASLGLMGIRERAAIVGGSADFEGVEGRGTIVSVRIPVGARVGATS
jgi:signal transduction histidine kinase